jgi:hypothetical protein
MLTMVNKVKQEGTKPVIVAITVSAHNGQF